MRTALANIFKAKRIEARMATVVRINRAQQIKSGLRRHDRFITFLGLVIVVSTYLIKEHLREGYKDWASSIERAETDYDFAVNMAEMHKDVRLAANDIQKLINHIITKTDFKVKPQIAALMQEAQDIADVQEFLNDQLVALDRLARFAKKLPDHDDEQEQIDRLRRYLVDSQNLNRKKRELFHAKGMRKKEAQDSETKLNRTIASMVATYGNDIDIDHSLSDLKAKIFEKATSKQDWYEHQSSVFKTITLILFILGSLIGLISKWAGIKAGVAEGS